MDAQCRFPFLMRPQTLPLKFLAGCTLLFASGACTQQVGTEGIGHSQDAVAVETPSEDVAEAGTARYDVLLVWGHLLPGGRGATPIDWNGVLSAEHGEWSVKRTLAFERRTDRVARRTDPGEVRFSSRTFGKHDGLVMSLTIPLEAEDAIELHYDGDDGRSVTVGLLDVLESPQELLRTSEGARMVIVARRHDEEPSRCERGFVFGAWNRARLEGNVLDGDGSLIGRLAGTYRSTSRAFAVRYYRGTSATSRGELSGRYRDGAFSGQIRVGTPDVGVIGGVYEEARAGDGLLVGIWDGRHCNEQ